MRISMPCSANAPSSRPMTPRLCAVERSPRASETFRMSISAAQAQGLGRVGLLGDGFAEEIAHGDDAEIALQQIFAVERFAAALGGENLLVLIDHLPHLL